jgi:hypothetical protein
MSMFIIAVAANPMHQAESFEMIDEPVLRRRVRMALIGVCSIFL